MNIMKMTDVNTDIFLILSLVIFCSPIETRVYNMDDNPIENIVLTNFASG
jgi:hypothetical protein